MLMTMTYEGMLAIWSIGPSEMLVVVVVAFVLYGSDLPQVARTWAKTFGELRRTLTNLQREFNNVVYSDPEPVRKLEYYPEFRDPQPFEAAADHVVEEAVDEVANGALAAEVPTGELPTGEELTAEEPTGEEHKDGDLNDPAAMKAGDAKRAVAE